MIGRFFATAALAAALACQLAGCAQTAGRARLGMAGSHTEGSFSMARLHEKQGRLSQARKLYETICREHPEHAKAHHRLGVVLTRLGQYGAASEHFLTALKYDRDNSDALADLGYAAFLQNDLAGAEDALRHGLRIDPDNRRAKANLGLVLGYQGRFDESYARFREVVPAAEAHANLAFIHAQRGEGDLAVERYSRALTLDRDLRSAARGLVELADLKNRARAAVARQEDSKRPNGGDVVQASAAAIADTPQGRSPEHGSTSVISDRATVSVSERTETFGSDEQENSVMREADSLPDQQFRLPRFLDRGQHSEMQVERLPSGGMQEDSFGRPGRSAGGNAAPAGHEAPATRNGEHSGQVPASAPPTDAGRGGLTEAFGNWLMDYPDGRPARQ